MNDWSLFACHQSKWIILVIRSTFVFVIVKYFLLVCIYKILKKTHLYFTAENHTAFKNKHLIYLKNKTTTLHNNDMFKLLLSYCFSKHNEVSYKQHKNQLQSFIKGPVQNVNHCDLIAQCNKSCEIRQLKPPSFVSGWLDFKAFNNYCSQYGQKGSI